LPAPGRPMIRILRINVPLGMVQARSGKRCPPQARAWASWRKECSCIPTLFQPIPREHASSMQLIRSCFAADRPDSRPPHASSIEMFVPVRNVIDRPPLGRIASGSPFSAAPPRPRARNLACPGRYRYDALDLNARSVGSIALTAATDQVDDHATTPHKVAPL
jgi:hypothetical protein